MDINPRKKKSKRLNEIHAKFLFFLYYYINKFKYLFPYELILKNHNFAVIGVSTIFSSLSMLSKSDVPRLLLLLYFLYKETTQAPPSPRLCCNPYFKLGTFNK